mgnify:FL=1
MTTQPDITLLLRRVGDGEPGAMERVVPLVYDELRHIARRSLRRGGGAMTLDTTALVHEAYVRLVDQTQSEFSGKRHFLAVCAVVMRNLVIDFARARHAAKRGGGAERVTLDEEVVRLQGGASIDAEAEDLLALDQALDRLEELDPKLARVVECRYFAGLTDAETALALDVTERSVRRYCVKAKALLQKSLSPPTS